MPKHGLLLAYSAPLPGGPRVRLRLARQRDADGIAELFARCGHEPDQLETVRLTRFDPRSRFVVCATALIEGREVVVGVGAIALGPEATGEPELVVADGELGEDLGDLLRGALVGRVLASAA